MNHILTRKNHPNHPNHIGRFGGYFSTKAAEIRRRKLQNFRITKLQQLAAVSPSRLPSLAKSTGLQLATVQRLRLQARLQRLGQ